MEIHFFFNLKLNDFVFIIEILKVAFKWHFALLKTKPVCLTGLLLWLRLFVCRPQYKKVFETVRCASQNSITSSDSVGSLNFATGGFVSSSAVTSGPRMSAKAQSHNVRRSSGSIYSSSSLGYPSLDSTGHSDYDSSQTDSDDGYP